MFVCVCVCFCLFLVRHVCARGVERGRREAGGSEGLCGLQPCRIRPRVDTFSFEASRRRDAKRWHSDPKFLYGAHFGQVADLPRGKIDPILRSGIWTLILSANSGMPRAKASNLVRHEIARVDKVLHTVAR